MARKFFYIAAGMLMLALSYHFGAGTAGAQSGLQVAAVGRDFIDYAVTTNGDLYHLNYDPFSGQLRPATLVGNIFGGAPTPALHESWGQVKARYRSTPGMTVTPGANDK